MLGLSQQALATRAGISLGTLNNIERGAQDDPKLSTLKAIEQALVAEGISFDLQSDGTMAVYYRPLPQNHARIILIVDDNAADRKLYKTWLGRQHPDYQFLEASDALAGFDSYLQHRPDCIILDFKMYGMDGFQMLAKLREGGDPLPPILFITGNHDPAIEKAARERGIRGYLNKNSLNAELLVNEVKRALD